MRTIQHSCFPWKADLPHCCVVAYRLIVYASDLLLGGKSGRLFVVASIIVLNFDDPRDDFFFRILNY